MDGTSSPWMDAPAAAKYLGMTKVALYAHCARGHLPHRRVGSRRMIFNRSELDAFLLGNTKSKEAAARRPRKAS